MLSASPKLREHFNVADWCYKPFFIKQHEGKALPIWLHSQTSLERVKKGFERGGLAITPVAGHSGRRAALTPYQADSCNFTPQDWLFSCSLYALPVWSSSLTLLSLTLSSDSCSCIKNPFRYFVLKLFFEPFVSEKKWLDHLLTCTWISSLCVSPWTSLFPHRWSQKKSV